MALSGRKIAIIGGGPAGLMAAEALVSRGARPHLFDAMPSLGRKFLMAGKSGLNLTHSEDYAAFVTRFGEANAALRPALDQFTPDDIRRWAEGLDIETFTGSSGRIFPTDFKAAPLLRHWLKRLRANGLTTHVRHRWQGWTDDSALRFKTREGEITFKADATILTLGGANWPQLGSDAAWTDWLKERGVEIAPFRPANCGFDVDWSPLMKERFAGTPVKSVALSADSEAHRGEFVMTEGGIEGSGVYTLSASLRDAIARDGKAVLKLDLTPDRSLKRLTNDLNRPRGKASFTNFLRKATGLSNVKSALLREYLPKETFNDMAALAQGIKALPLTLRATRPIEEAISSAGGISFDAIDEGFMLRNLPGVFCAGEMLDWEAPTGGYLLTACFATGKAAGQAAAKWLEEQ